MRQQSSLRLFLWWVFFTVLCIWVHDFVPGLDCFGPAILVLMHLKRYREALWLTPIWMIINEGAGTLAFGLSVLWTGGLILIFLLLCGYLTSSNFIFLLALSILAGLWHFAAIALMAALQEITVLPDQLLIMGLQTTIAFPLLWVGMLTAFKRWGQSRHVSF